LGGEKQHGTTGGMSSEYIYMYIHAERNLLEGIRPFILDRRENKRGTIMGISHIKRIVEELLS
jgi:hypothetical protein